MSAGGTGIKQEEFFFFKDREMLLFSFFPMIPLAGR